MSIRQFTKFACITVISLSLVACNSKNYLNRPHLEAALQTANWLESVAVETEHGIAWPSDPEKPDEIIHHLYSGTPGPILFFIELYKATGDKKYLSIAKRAADDLLKALPTDLKNSEAGLWVGIAGQGFTLHQVYKATNKQRYLDGTKKCIYILKTNIWISNHNWGVERNEVTDIVAGTAGIGLFLLYVAKEFHDDEALELAKKAGDGLIMLARQVEIDGETVGLKWAMDNEFPRLMPNFSHGTAGVCYFLATLQQHLNDADNRYLDAALGGARYLLSIANTENGGCVIFHHEPDGEDLYYLGWCHGPVGTSRLFYRLAQATNDQTWQTWVARGSQSLISSEIDSKRTPGFWNNVGQCCGSAGVASYFLDLYKTTNQEKYKQFATSITQDILKRATKIELQNKKVGLKWIQAEHRVQPDFLQAQTGYMQGAAGIGLWLLKLDAIETGREFSLHLPDSPY